MTESEKCLRRSDYRARKHFLFIFDSSRRLKLNSNLPVIIALTEDAARTLRDMTEKARQGERKMFDCEILGTGVATEPADAQDCFARGLVFASGREGDIDMVEAHKWFNIAASRGHAESAQMRREVAAQMSDAEIGQAQRAARDWLKAHPLPVMAAPEPIRAAA